MKTMFKQIITTSVLCSTVMASSVFAHDHGAKKEAEKGQHFAALPAPDVNTALCNLAQYNAILVDVTSAETLVPVAMVKVHELTYTLENALARLKTTLEASAVALEEVHLASERMDQAVVKAEGEKYLSLLSSISSECQK